RTQPFSKLLLQPDIFLSQITVRLQDISIHQRWDSRDQTGRHATAGLTIQIFFGRESREKSKLLTQHTIVLRIGQTSIENDIIFNFGRDLWFLSMAEEMHCD